ncbi:uncharacterized protein LOC106649765 isoform X1 [Trichogramma pretiosum]|uniref:uncharacterized protein LOC106649765 isoform X1 n=1 Tax=Trichogramma pretiosum TaxID=7493 RepID=UPI0006C98523|nr:uncharacterized protein LOC106649765 isoform X1 [Trichogramma pretiosum]
MSSNIRDLNTCKIISAAYALGDAIDNICQYLKIRDLMRVSSVCKLWNESVTRELSKRGPQMALLPDESHSCEQIWDILRIKPYIGLLFIGPSLRERNTKNLEFQVLSMYKKYFPQYLVAIGVDESIMNEQVIVSCPGLLGNPNGILGLFIPEYQDLKIKISFCTNGAGTDAVEKITSEITPDDKKIKSTIIMFCNSHQGYSIALQVWKLIRKRFKQKNYTLWGGVFDDDLKAINCSTVEHVDSKKTAVFAMSITGSCLESWSMVVDCTNTKSDINKKLLHLKNKLNLKRHTIGLVCGPRYVEDLSKSSYENMYRNSHELMAELKRIFSNIPFIGVFNYGYNCHFGVDSSSDDNRQDLALKMAMSIMIISYD